MKAAWSLPVASFKKPNANGEVVAELFTRAAGGPPGVFKLVNGMGETAGRELALHKDVARSITP